MTQKTFQFRLYPTNPQQEFLARQFGSVRYIYNYFLSLKKENYNKNKTSSSYNQDSKTLTQLKTQPELDWLYQVNSQTLQFPLKCLDTAFQRFFKGKSKYPRFHSRKNRQCIKISQNFKIKDKYLHIPKLKTGIEIRQHRDIQGTPISCFISKNSDGRYFVSIVCEVDIKPLEKNKKIIGIDVGLKHLAITSDNDKIPNPKFYKKLERELAYHQRQFSKKQKGSKNREQQRIKVAQIHQQIKDSRSNYLHQLSHTIINENQVIITEDLKIENMVKNHKLAKSIIDASWGELNRQLRYKADWYGRVYYQIDTFFPSSKLCHHCHYKLDDLPLNVREWECPQCQNVNDRDLNAALNIKEQGIKDLGLEGHFGYGTYPNKKPGEAPCIGSMSQEASLL